MPSRTNTRLVRPTGQDNQSGSSPVESAFDIAYREQAERRQTSGYQAQQQGRTRAPRGHNPYAPRYDDEALGIHEGQDLRFQDSGLDDDPYYKREVYEEMGAALRNDLDRTRKTGKPYVERASSPESSQGTDPGTDPDGYQAIRRRRRLHAALPRDANGSIDYASPEAARVQEQFAVPPDQQRDNLEDPEDEYEPELSEPVRPTRSPARSRPSARVQPTQSPAAQQPTKTSCQYAIYLEIAGEQVFVECDEDVHFPSKNPDERHPNMPHISRIRNKAVAQQGVEAFMIWRTKEPAQPKPRQRTML